MVVKNMFKFMCTQCSLAIEMLRTRTAPDGEMAKSDQNGTEISAYTIDVFDIRLVGIENSRAVLLLVSPILLFFVMCDI